MKKAMAVDESGSPDHKLSGYQELIRALYTKSKRHWLTGTIFTILALFPVPVLTLMSLPRWYGLVAACILALLGKWLAWWASVLNGEAGVIHRMVDYHRSFKWPINKEKIVDIRDKYRDIDSFVSRSKNRADDYYDHERRESHDSYFIVAKMFMESSWWTERLAKKTAMILLILLVILTILIVIFVVWSWMAEMSVSDGVIWLVVCIVIASDLIILQRRYVSLGLSSENAYGRIRELHQREGNTNEKILAVVNEYIIDRSCGPPIPEFVYRHYKCRLNRLWAEELRS